MAKQSDKPDSPPKPKDVELASLSRSGRIAAWIFGGGFSGGGIAATFLTENQVGTGALLLLGTLFAIAGITGRFPSRVQIGENSVDYSPKVLDKVAEVAPPDVAAEVIESVAEEAPPQVQQYANQLLTRVEFEASVLAGARQAAQILNRQTGNENSYTYTAESNLISDNRMDRSFDVVVRSNEQSLYIDRVVIANYLDIAKQLRNGASRLRALSGLGLIVIVGKPPLDVVNRFMRNMPGNVHLLVVDDELAGPQASLRDKVASEIVRLLSSEAG